MTTDPPIRVIDISDHLAAGEAEEKLNEQYGSGFYILSIVPAQMGARVFLRRKVGTSGGQKLRATATGKKMLLLFF